MSSKHYPVTHEPSRTRRTATTALATDTPRPPATLPVLAGTVVATAAVPLALAFPGVAVSLAILAVGALVVRRD
jgi:MFS superfamily sulfate permease-like transporter